MRWKFVSTGKTRTRWPAGTMMGLPLADLNNSIVRRDMVLRKPAAMSQFLAAVKFGRETLQLR
jgi:hypothetical protein